MRVACSTSAWKGDLDHALSRVKALGFDYVDVICIAAWGHVQIDNLVSDFDGTVETVRGLLAHHDLTPIAANLGITPSLFERDGRANKERRRNTETFCRFMNAFDLSVAGYYPGTRQGDDDRPAAYKATLESIREISEIGGEHNLRLGPELHWNTNIQTLAEAELLFSDLPELTVVYDPSHFIMQGIPIEKTDFILKRSHHVHLRAADREKMQSAVSTSTEALRWILDELNRIDYSGDISIEYLPSDDIDVERQIAATKELIGAK
jgi:sugar phosphate isomerase/epimerase